MKLVVVIALVALAAQPLMPADASIAAFLAELSKRQPSESARQSARDQIEAACVKLRSIFEKHPKQKQLFQLSKAKLKATRKTRRAGATAGGVRELLARALEIPGFRATYVASTRIEARDRAWRSDSKAGFVDVLALIAEPQDTPGVLAYALGGIRIEVREAELALEFGNGSRIELFGADNLRAINKKRGNAKHVFWIDEAQDFRFLEEFYGGTVVGSLTDFEGECWISGTPGRDCAGMFYEITRDDGETLPGWEVHEIAVVDNPFFGAVVWEDGRWFVVDNIGQQTGPYADEQAADEAAVKIRWERTAGAAIKKNGWSVDHPDLIREWYARWIKTDTRHVYPVNAVPPTMRLTYAPMRLQANTFRPQDGRWYDHDAAVLDLPRKPNGKLHEWLFAIGEDFGNFPDPFAIVVWAFTFERPDIYEMFSWKAVKVLPDDQRVYTEMLWHAMGNIIVLVGDPAGREGELEEWRTRFDLPIENAEKANKNVYQEFMAGDIRKALVHYREGSPLLDEHRHLVYLPTKPGKTRKEHADRKIADGRVPGNHCFVAGTLVRAARGDVPIESIAVGERVWTRQGLRTVVRSMPTRVAPTFDLVLEDGRAIRGTGDHRIATPDGWKQLAHLTRNDMVIGWASTDQPRPSYGTGATTGAIRTPIIEPRAPISRAPKRSMASREPSSFIARSTSTLMDRFRAAITFITRMAIPATTDSAISRSSSEPLICASTRPNPIASPSHSAPSRLPAPPRRNGTAPPKVAPGTSSMPSVWLRIARRCADAAWSAMDRFGRSITPPRFAACAVMPSGGATAVSMTKIEPAQDVASCSVATSTLAPATAPSRVRLVQPTNVVEQTYDLTVEGVPEFFANGICVHNCSDAGLYSHRHLNHYMFREGQKDDRPPIEQLADQHEQAIDRAHEIREALRDQEQDSGYGEYEY